MKDLITQLTNAMNQKSIIAFGYTKISDGAVGAYIGQVMEIRKHKYIVIANGTEIKSFRIENIHNHSFKTFVPPVEPAPRKLI
jgi:hypothetical protein